MRCVLGWYRQGLDDPGSTYWYLTGVPELLELVADRLDAGGEAGR